MNIFEFITPEEIDDLPDDDSQAAFVAFVKIAQRRLGERLSTLDGQDETGWRRIEDARHGFMNVVVAAAKKYEIEPFASLSVPRIKQFNEEKHRQFTADLDHYMTQLLLDNSSRAKRDSVYMSPDLKSTIRTYVYHLRELIEKADDLDGAKRQELLRRLADFEAELEKKRLSLMAVTVLVITFLGAPGAIWASGEMAVKLLTNIQRAVGEAKIADDATRRLPSAAAPMVITGPRPNEPNQLDEPEDFGRRPPARRGDLDDEIPF